MAAQRGQGMSEYIIIAAMIAVTSIGVFTALGKTLRIQNAGLAKEIAGLHADPELAAAAADEAVANANNPTARDGLHSPGHIPTDSGGTTPTPSPQPTPVPSPTPTPSPTDPNPTDPGPTDPNQPCTGSSCPTCPGP
jgi:Flp pilus assembly pilin Flp